MIKKMSLMGILTFSIIAFGNQVSANQYSNTGTSSVTTNQYNSTGTNGVNTNNQGNYNTGYGARTTAVDYAPRTNWGWLGLLGLAGLAGLRGRNRNNDPERQR
jgi:MYXO-CTERM domain-containing protein